MVDKQDMAVRKMGPLIRQFRKSSGMSQEALSEKLGVSYQQVQKYEHGRCRITVDRLIQIAQALGVSPSVFICEEDGHICRDSEESRVLALFRSLGNSKLRQAAIRVLDAMSETE